MPCRVPNNQPIYQALLNKAASYPDNQLFKAIAYSKAAESVAAHLYEIRKGYLVELLPYVGPSIAKYIKDFIDHPQPTGSFLTMPPIQRQIALGGPVVPQCKVPANQPIYLALMKKRDSYPSSATQPVSQLFRNAAKAKAVRKAAEAVLACDFDIAQNTDSIWWLCRESLKNFIIEHINTTKTSQATTAATVTPKLLTPKEVMGGGVSSEQLRLNTTLIPTCSNITVQELIDALQTAIKKNPAVAAMEVVPDLLDDGNNLGPYDVTIQYQKVFISSGERNTY